MNPKLSVSDMADILGVTPDAVHKAIKSKGLTVGRQNNKLYLQHESTSILFDFKFHYPKVIVFQNNKGGEGKSTLVHSVAVCANLYGARVLCIDSDPQGNLTQAMGIDAEQSPVLFDYYVEGNLAVEDIIVPVINGLDIIPSRIENEKLNDYIPMKQKNINRMYSDLLAPVIDKYDLIIFDCPPNLSHNVAAVALFSDLIIIPVTPHKFSYNGLKMCDELYQRLSTDYRPKDKPINLKILFNRFKATTSLSHEFYNQLLEHPRYKIMLYKLFIRDNQEFANVITRNQSIFDTLKALPSKEDIHLITREILGIKEQIEAMNK